MSPPDITLPPTRQAAAQVAVTGDAIDSRLLPFVNRKIATRRASSRRSWFCRRSLSSSSALRLLLYEVFLCDAAA